MTPGVPPITLSRVSYFPSCFSCAATEIQSCGEYWCRTKKRMLDKHEMRMSCHFHDYSQPFDYLSATCHHRVASGRCWLTDRHCTPQEPCPADFGPWGAWRSTVAQFVFDPCWNEWVFLIPNDLDDAKHGPYDLPADLLTRAGWSP